MAAPKAFHLGTHRTRTPQQTWAWVRPHFPRLGITRIADLTRLDHLGIPVYQAVRPASRNLSVSQGKGATAWAAKISAVMEAAELWHAESLDVGAIPGERAVLSPRELAPANPIPLDSLPWRYPPGPLMGTAFEWLAVDSPLGGRRGWLPRAMLELDLYSPTVLTPRPWRQTSNGLASGNDREEALLHGLCELVERHALARVRHTPALRRPLDPDSVEGPAPRAAVERIRAAGWRLALHDITGDLGIPVAMAALAAPDLPGVWHGSGCHPNPDVALSRALTEAAQTRLTFIAGTRDDIQIPDDPADGVDTFGAFQVPAGGAAANTLPDLSTATVADDLTAVLGRFADHGLEVYSLDLTRPGLGIPVVRAFSPDLQEAYYG